MRKTSRRPETEAAYLREGERHLARASRRHPEIGDPIDALVIDVTADAAVLTPNSVSLYRQQYAAIVTRLCNEKGLSDTRRREIIEGIWAALAARRGKPPEPRTSSKKRLDIPKAEARLILRLLAKRAKDEGADSEVLVLGLVLFFAPRVGCRLCEWEYTQIEGDDLVVRQAKVSETRAGFPTRRISLTHLSERQREAITVLLDLLPEAIRRYGSFRRWHRAAAELLARSCEKRGLKRISFYAFRHIAIGVWAAAGLSPWQIAALAGHASIRTRRRYYNGGGASGWKQDAVPEPDAERVAALELRAVSAELPRPREARQDEFDFEEPPAFRAAPVRGPSTPADWRAYAETIRVRGESLLKPRGDTSEAPAKVAEGESVAARPSTFRR